MSNQYSMKGSVKPLKGGVVTSNYGNFETLTATNLQLENISVVGLLEDGIFESVIIKDSEIINTVIGAQSPNVAYFTDLYTTQNLTFRSNVFGSDVTWDPSNLIFSINNSSFVVNGCSYLGNIEICENYIRATNPDGNINIYPKDSGSVYVNGPLYNSTSIGNFYTDILNGSVILNSKFDLLFNSTRGGIITTVDSQNLITKNGDIELRTSNIENVNTSLINHLDDSTIIFTNTSNYLKEGDVIKLSGTSPFIYETFLTVGSILSDTSFAVNSTIDPTITFGTIDKVANTNILLNTDSFVKIPTDTKLIFGDTSNSISGNTGSLLIKSLGDTVLRIPTSSALVVPIDVPIEFGNNDMTTGNSIKYDGSAINFVAENTLKMEGSLLKVNVTNASFYDPVLTIGDNPENDLKDRGIEYKYYDTDGSLKLGWFGYKTSTQRFTFIRDATNTDETITGEPGEFEIGDISAQNITIREGGAFDMNCGSITNIKLLTGCSGTINVNATSNLNITSGNRISLVAGGDIYVPNNIPLTLGTSGSLIREDTYGTIEMLANNNIKLVSNSVSVPVSTYISFDGTSVGSQRISSNMFGDLILTTNKNVYLTTTSGNVILPGNDNGSFTSASLQLGNPTEVIHGNTSGISIMTVSSNASANVIASGDINMRSSSGNVLVESLKSDINLYTTSGNVRLLPTTSVVFGISGTGNSIRSDTSNNMVLNGNTTNTIDIKNVKDINLGASSGVNLSSGTFLNLSSIKDRYIVGDTLGNILLNNSFVDGSTIISSSNMLIRNTNTYISSSNMVISGNVGSVINIDMDSVLLKDRIITLGNEVLLEDDNKDRGLEYKYHNSSDMKLGWFGWKNMSGRLTYYSDAVNTDEIITGTLGSVEFDSAYLKNNLIFTTTGSIDMFCGTIENVSKIMGCTDLNMVVPNDTNISSGVDVNISSGSVINMKSIDTNIVSVDTNMISSGDISATAKNILLDAEKVQVPYNVPVAFGNTSNSISADGVGNMTISVMNGSGRLVLNSDVQINGTTTNVYSTVTNLQDPIFSLGGVTGPLINDGKDRGIEFKWNTGDSTKTGFFGYKNASSRFVFIQSGVNIDEVYSGSYGDVEFGDGYFTNLDVSGGTISNVGVISGGDISIVSTSDNLSLSSGNINLPTNSSVNFGSPENSISNSLEGLLNISSLTDVNFSMGSNKSITIPETVYLNMGSSSLVNTGGNFQISNSTGNIDLIPTGGNVTIPVDTFLEFGSTSNSIISTNGQLLINGYSGVSINTTTFLISGDVNIGGTVTAQVDANFDINKYILPLGTSQLVNINSIDNYSTIGNVKISTVLENNFAEGDSVILKSTNSVPVVDGTYTITEIISVKEFVIVKSGGVSSSGSFGVVKSNLMTYQGKDVGIQVNYWTTVGNASLTSGSLGYKTGFFGYKNDTQRWTYYNNATITNDVVTGTVSDIEVNKVFTTKMSGFELDGNVLAGSNVVSGSNFQIGGGSVNGTTIGVNTAQTGRFTNLSNTVSANLSNVTLASSLAYTFERYTLSSSGLKTRSPTTTYAISLFSVSGPNYTSSSGTMPSNSANIPDGTLKILVCSSMGVGSSHTVYFGTGKLIAPNPLNVASQPEKLTFKRQGQSAHMVFDGVAGAWILLSNGVYVS